ncbi:MAG: class I SAM-dependent methyltransferase [Pseudonocardia sp.]|nr:class I SAM-dependent methyltransferase [Pseudonocardia sp.]
MSITPFTDPALIAGPLYADANRLARRTSALHAAKISGPDATATITDLAATAAPGAGVVCDIGCGRGSTTAALAARLAPAQLIAVDQSAALLATVTARLARAGQPVTTLVADFHHIPLLDRSVDLAVAAFCLYHFPHPQQALTEIRRCLRPGGHVVLATKSACSYREIDQLVATSGLDPDAVARPSLYQSLHTDTITQITEGVLTVEAVVSQQHVFRFNDLNHIAAYVATSPKYQLAKQMAGDPVALGAALRARLLDRPVTATSTVTYVLARRR